MRKTDKKRTKNLIPDQHKSVECPFCPWKTMLNKHLNVHLRNKHHFVLDDRQNTNWSCFSCSFRCKTHTLLREHFIEKHNLPLTVHTNLFESEQHYENWLLDLNSTKFVTRQTTRRPDGVTVRLMICHRSGRIKRRGYGLRAQKITTKCGRDCTAFCRAEHNSLTGRVTVDYSLDHCGHEIEPWKFPLNQNHRVQILHYLAENHSSRWIISHMQKNLDMSKMDTRLHYLKHSDIQNIRKKYAISPLSEQESQLILNDGNANNCDGQLSSEIDSFALSPADLLTHSSTWLDEMRHFFREAADYLEAIPVEAEDQVRFWAMRFQRQWMSS